MQYLSIPLAILAFACILHGVPSLITIHKHYHNDDDDN